MPLPEKITSEKQLSEVIAKLIEEGYDKDQATAIAYDKAVPSVKQ